MSQKYTDARYPEKINDLIDNEGNVNPEIIPPAPTPEPEFNIYRVELSSDIDIEHMDDEGFDPMPEEIPDILVFTQGDDDFEEEKKGVLIKADENDYNAPNCITYTCCRSHHILTVVYVLGIGFRSDLVEIGGTKLYRHHLVFTSGDEEIGLENTKSSPYTKQDFTELNIVEDFIHSYGRFAYSLNGGDEGGTAVELEYNSVNNKVYVTVIREGEFLSFNYDLDALSSDTVTAL